MKQFKTVIAPKGCEDYLTEGKEYEVSNINPHSKYGATFNIISDQNERQFCLLKHCGHLKGQDWIIKEESKTQTEIDKEIELHEQLRANFFNILHEKCNGFIPKDEMYHMDYISDAIDDFIVKELLTKVKK